MDQAHHRDLRSVTQEAVDVREGVLTRHRLQQVGPRQMAQSVAHGNQAAEGAHVGRGQADEGIRGPQGGGSDVEDEVVRADRNDGAPDLAQPPEQLHVHQLSGVMTLRARVRPLAPGMKARGPNRSEPTGRGPVFSTGAVKTAPTIPPPPEKHHVTQRLSRSARCWDDSVVGPWSMAGDCTIKYSPVHATAECWVPSHERVGMTTSAGENVKRPSVVVLGPLPKELLDRIQDRCDVTVVEDPGDRSAVELALKDAEGVLLSNRIKVDDALLAGAKHLRVISNHGVGLDHIDLEATERRKIEVLTTPVLMDAVADLVMTFALMLTRRMPEAIQAVRTRHWGRLPLGHDLRDKTLFIIGFGRIGQEVARRALCFKMKVLFFDLRDDLPEMDGAERVPDVHSGLGVADFVSLHVDLNRGTRHLIGARELEIMKPSAYLINTAVEAWSTRRRSRRH